MKTNTVASVFVVVLGLACTGCGSDARSGDETGRVESNANTKAPVPAASQEPPSASGQQIDYPLGEPRDDLERFYGLYGDDSHPGRDFFVAPARRNPDAREQIPSGYLMVGAMWGDVAPWYMKSIGDTRFEQQWVGQFSEPKTVAFEAEPGEQATAMQFESGVFAERRRLERLGDLPEKFK